jgi:predicted RNA methylase
MQLSSEVRDVLECAIVTGNRLALTGQLDRKQYEKVNKVLELMGGKWSRKEKAHLFEDDAEQVVADAVATGAVIDFRKEFQFFETPPPIATKLAGLALLAPDQAVLEPSAGRGSLVRALRARGAEPVACELWDQNREHLRAMGVSLVDRDFLELAGHDFDRIVANPPFARQQDIAHVTHMWKLLRPGGRLVSIMSPGWTFREDRRSVAFREIVEGAGGEWTMLDEGAFKSSGTSVSAGIVSLEKEV